MKIELDKTVYLEEVKESDAKLIFEAVEKNRNFLRQWLSFVDKMQSIEFAENFLKTVLQKRRDGIEYGFSIFENSDLIGRISIHKIDNQNRIGEIGYWLVESAQGKGIMTKACKAMIAFGFIDLKLNRIEIKCGTENSKSSAIPMKLNFTKEGIIRQSELLNGKFIDLNLFSLLADEHSK